MDFEVATVIINGLDLIDSGNNVTDFALSLIVKHFHANDLAARCYTGNSLQGLFESLDLLARSHPGPLRDAGSSSGLKTAGYNPSDMRPVTKLINQSGRAPIFATWHREVAVNKRKCYVQRALILKVPVFTIDSRVDHRPHNFPALGQKGAPGGIGLYGTNGMVDQRLKCMV